MKHFLTLIVTMIAVSSFAATNWNAQTKTEIETFASERIEKWQNDKTISASTKDFLISEAKIDKAILTSLVGKDAKNTTLNDLRTLISAEYAKIETNPTKVKEKTNKKVAVFVLYINRFQGLIPNVINDSELGNSKFVEVHYTYRYRRTYQKYFTTDAILAIYSKYASSSEVTDNNLYVRWMWESHKAIINSLSAKDALKELQQIKRFAYQRLDKSEDWKRIAVEVELMIKGLQ